MAKKIGIAVSGLVALLLVVLLVAVILPAQRYKQGLSEVFRGLQDVEKRAISMAEKYPDLTRLHELNWKKKEDREKLAKVLEAVEADLNRMQAEVSALRGDYDELKPPPKFQRVHDLMGETLETGERLTQAVGVALNTGSGVARGKLLLLLKLGKEIKDVEQLAKEYERLKTQLVRELEKHSK